MRAILLLEDGRIFQGKGFGARATKAGEVVFNTAMTGYQETLTDPSYAEQILVMTSSHIGNTGINAQDAESEKIWLHGFIARHFNKQPSNHRAEHGLQEYLIQHNIPAMEKIDTRALVRHIRDKGAMKGIISTEEIKIEELQRQLDAWPGMLGRKLGTEVCAKESYLAHKAEQPRLKINLIDGGCKNNIIRLLRSVNCQIRVVPLTAPEAEWLRDCDGIFLSNGPGDPAALTETIATIKKIIGIKPIVGICLGHQLLALGLGAKTFKLPFGHRGINHPIRDERTGKIEISSQNHGFCVERDSIIKTGAQISHTNLNDDTVAGLIHQKKMVMGVQFHPEASPGPHDSAHLVTESYLNFIESCLDDKT